MNDEIFEIVNKAGEVIGLEKRSIVHGNPKLMHRVVHCLIFNSKQELYLQLRSMNKDVQPGKWDTSVGGHLMPKETIFNAIKRETSEELNINLKNFKHLYQYIMSNDIETELVDTFMATYDALIIPNYDEISEGKFWTKQDIDKNLNNNIFTPNFIDEWNRYNTIYLKGIK